MDPHHDAPITPSRIVLDRADYFELRALIRDCEVIDLETRQAAAHYGRLQGEATRRKAAFWERLAAFYGFDAAKVFTWDDDTLTLHEQPKGP